MTGIGNAQGNKNLYQIDHGTAHIYHWYMTLIGNDQGNSKSCQLDHKIAHIYHLARLCSKMTNAIANRVSSISTQFICIIMA